MDGNGCSIGTHILSYKPFLKKCLTIIQSLCIIINKSRRYLSWIEGLTTNQNVIGSNPIRRTN